MVISIPLSKTGKYAGQFFAIIDDDDELLSESDWCVNKPKTTTPYAHKATRNAQNRKTLISLHRCVLERMLERPLVKGEYADHINRNGLDNRRENLRLATSSQNGANREVGKNSKSGVRGVYSDKKGVGWRAFIKFQSKQMYLGHFADIEIARKIRNEKGRELFGEFWRDC